MRWALGLVPVVAGGGWATFQWLESRDAADKRIRAARSTQEAAWLCFARHPDTRRILSAALEAGRFYAPAWLVNACWYLEQGEWNLTRAILSHPRLRDTPEARLLLELAERRPRSSDWRHAFFEAWKSLGRPDFSKSPLLPEPLEVFHVLAHVRGAWEAADPNQRLMLVALEVTLAEASHPGVLEQVRATSSVPLLLALREQLLLIETRVPSRQLLLPAVDERLGQLAGPSPRTLQLALFSFLAGSVPSALLERGDLEVLEKLVVLSEWKQPSSERFFLETRERFEGLLPAPGHHAWLLASSAQGGSLGMELLRRAQASKAHLSEDEQRWMGRLLWEVGARLREQRSRLELEMGLRLQLFGSELTGHSDTRMDSITLWVELGQWEESVKRSAYNRWPLASLQEESCELRARDEHAWLRAFAGKGELP